MRNLFLSSIVHQRSKDKHYGCILYLYESYSNVILPMAVKGKVMAYSQTEKAATIVKHQNEPTLDKSV